MPIGLAALIPAAISGIGSLISGRKGDNAKSTGTSSQTSNQTTSSTSTIEDKLGPEAQALLSQLLPQIMQMIGRKGSVDPRISETVAQQRTMGVNQNADAIRDTLTGNAAARGLTYSAPAGLARGVAENFRGQGISNIIGDKAGMDIDIARGNSQESRQNLGLASNILNMLPQTRTMTNSGTQTGTQTGTNSGNVQQKSGSLLGDALQLGSNIYSTWKGSQPQQFNFVPEFNKPPQPAPLPNITPPTLSAQIPSMLNLPPIGMQGSGNRPYTSSSITYDIPGAR